LVEAVKKHLNTIRMFALATDENVYSCG